LHNGAEAIGSRFAVLIDKLCRGIDSLNRPELAAGMLAYKGGICRTENCSTVPHTSWQPTRRGAGRDARHYGRRGRLPLHRTLEMRRACFFGVLEIGSRKAGKKLDRKSTRLNSSHVKIS